MNKLSILSVAALLLFSTVFSQEKDPVLITIGGNEVTLSEFENIYHKNNDAQLADPKSLDEYVKLFVNFKLKVKAAEDLGLDTTQAFVDELAGYRRQLAQPYLVDKDLNENLIKEAYERLKEDVNADHVLVKISPDASPNDSLQAYNKIMSFRKRLVNGESIEKIKKELGEITSQSKVLAEQLGYFTAFQMVYPFESAAFNTPVGTVSNPVRTRFGYHVIQVNDRRASRGEIRAAHIMVKLKKNATDEEKTKAKSKIDEIYQKLEGGASFEELAKLYSDDKNSGAKGGELPWFGTGKMVPKFEDAAFSLKEDGTTSKPIQTRYGWHIIKRLEKKELKSFDEMKSEIKAKISRDSRASMSRESLLKKLKEEYSYNPKMNEIKDFYKVVDNSYFTKKWSADKAKDLTAVIFTLKDNTYGDKQETYTQQDFAQFLEKRMRPQKPKEIEKVVDDMYAEWVDTQVMQFENENLEAKYPEFRALMKEYRDGILLFELMDKKVWTKAVKDTAGLKDYYNNNKNNFMWDERLDATIYTCTNPEMVKLTRSLLNKRRKKGYNSDYILEKVNADSQLNLKVEKGVFLKGENDIIDATPWTDNSISESVMNGKTVFVDINKKIAPTPKKLSESRGLVTAEYQNYLEQEWIKELQQRYDVHVDRKVLSLVK